MSKHDHVTEMIKRNAGGGISPGRRDTVRTAGEAPKGGGAAGYESLKNQLAPSRRQAKDPRATLNRSLGDPLGKAVDAMVAKPAAAMGVAAPFKTSPAGGLNALAASVYATLNANAPKGTTAGGLIADAR